MNTITRQELEACFHMPSADAASLLGVGSTMLKRVCRKFGINRCAAGALQGGGRLGRQCLPARAAPA